MRYELDSNGYICKVFFGCLSGTCTEYEGEVPTGYETLEEWATNANIRAYKIEDNNLVYDETRNAELESEWARCTGINAMAIGLSGNIAHKVTTAWQETKIVCDQLRNEIGDGKLTFENNAIKIGAGVRYVRVSANAMIQGIANHQVFGIMKNDTYLATGYYRATNASYYGTISLSTVIVEVSEGDELFLMAGAGTTGTLTIAGGNFTHLSVEVVE